MTNAQTTQIGAEQWAVGAPVARATQIGVEYWAVGGTPTIGVMTQIAIEQWASVPTPSAKGQFNMPMLGM